jgi:hypothetical protein
MTSCTIGQHHLSQHFRAENHISYVLMHKKMTTALPCLCQLASKVLHGAASHAARRRHVDKAAASHRARCQLHSEMIHTNHPDGTQAPSTYQLLNQVPARYQASGHQVSGRCQPGVMQVSTRCQQVPAGVRQVPARCQAHVHQVPPARCQAGVTRCLADSAHQVACRSPPGAQH